MRRLWCHLFLSMYCLAAANGSAQTPLTNVTFVAFDTETTGLHWKESRCVEIGVVKFRNGELVGTRSWLVNPGMPIPESARNVHGITDAMVTDSPPFRKVYPEFLAFIDDAVLLAHNAPFDMTILEAEAHRCALPVPTNVVLDTLRLSRAWFPDIKTRNLAALVEALKIQPGMFHRGQADAEYLKPILEAGLSQHADVTSLEMLTNVVGVLHFGKATRGKQTRGVTGAGLNGAKLR